VEDGASIGLVHVCPWIGSSPPKDVVDYQPGAMSFGILKESEGTFQCALSQHYDLVHSFGDIFTLFVKSLVGVYRHVRPCRAFIAMVE
jgi:hypothetical protein